MVLAAGQGTRMKSRTPKVLHEVAERPLVSWVLHAAHQAGVARTCAVLGHDRERVKARLQNCIDRLSLEFAYQEEQLGTGHAVRCALASIAARKANDANPWILILYGDCPLIRSEQLRRLVRETSKSGSDLGLFTCVVENPGAYGRILRQGGRVIGIREYKDCTEREREIREVNPGVYLVRRSFLEQAIDALTSDNVQGELYLTDIVEAAARASGAHDIQAPMTEFFGVNDRADLAVCEQEMQSRIVAQHQHAGVTFRSPKNVFVGAEVKIAPDVTIEAGVELRGQTVIESGAHIETGTILSNATVRQNAHLKPYCVVAESEVGEHASVGPFAHLRSGTVLGSSSKIGNFVETKKTTLGKESKAGHLAYLGNGVIGERVNIGAGTIFCNYDGIQKHTTVLEDDVFIGSDSQLVAPITVKRGAYVASGSTVTRDVPSDALAISRVKQDNKEGYASRLRARFKGSQTPEDANSKTEKPSK
ncbi:MAG: bifunctional UDP-N-acetylglucosamine diphosphorylase/glucosamine-1-phosphate N-acetyltransferase GlmU [Myxococcota bacterium]